MIQYSNFCPKIYLLFNYETYVHHEVNNGTITNICLCRKLVNMLIMLFKRYIKQNIELKFLSCSYKRF